MQCLCAVFFVWTTLAVCCLFIHTIVCLSFSTYTHICVRSYACVYRRCYGVKSNPTERLQIDVFLTLVRAVHLFCPSTLSSQGWCVENKFLPSNSSAYKKGSFFLLLHINSLSSLFFCPRTNKTVLQSVTRD